MNVLIDTNIFIPLEPTSAENLHAKTQLMSEVFRLASKARWNLFYHPSIKEDIARDKDLERAEMRRQLLAKYHELPDAPYILDDSPPELAAPQGLNDWVDGNLVLSVVKNAVDILVTDDEGIHRKGKKLGVDDRIKRSAEILEELQDFYEKTPKPPPAVVSCKAHALDEKDPIFDGLRADYSPHFDDWLIKVKRNQRDCFVIRGPADELAGLCIIKPEEKNEYGFDGKVLKLCTFKVSDRHFKNRYGELLLKPVFDHLEDHDYDHAFVTVLEKYPEVVGYLKEFGFEDSGKRTKLGEVVLLKRQKPAAGESDELAPLEFNRLFGPWRTKFEGYQSYLVPIRPEFHDLLFPELMIQRDFLPSKPCGNSIRKAYLSNSKIKKIQPGDHVFFYRSGDLQSLTVLGIVEQTRISANADEIKEFVKDRTVYTHDDIQSMCSAPVLAIKFRRVKFFDPPLAYKELKENGVLVGRPQSILKIKEEGLKWLMEKI